MSGEGRIVSPSPEQRIATLTANQKSSFIRERAARLLTERHPTEYRHLCKQIADLLEVNPARELDLFDAQILLDRGLTLRQIADQTGCTISRASRVLIPLLRSKGLSSAEVGYRLGCSERNVTRVMALCRREAQRETA